MPSILVIDDEPAIRLFCRMCLEAAGYQVYDAADGEQGVRAHRLLRADLILCDVFMPNKAGLETLLALRREFPGVKVVVMSGGSLGTSRSFLPDALLLGAVGVLPKPFGTEQLLAAVKAALPSPTRPE
jgi:CheY-like chemotaxis protein